MSYVFNYYKLGLRSPAPPKRLREATPQQPSPWPTLARLAGGAILLGAGIAALRAARGSTPARGHTVHDREVERLAKAERQRGCAVAADIHGWPKPPIIRGRRPDVYSICEGGERVIEVERPASVDTAHSVAQQRAFTAWERRVSDREFVLTVTER